MTDLQWKIEDGWLLIRKGDTDWYCNGYRTADIIKSAIRATQEKCAQVADGYARHAAARLPNAQKCEDDIAICMLETEEMMSKQIASAIRALKMETSP